MLPGSRASGKLWEEEAAGQVAGRAALGAVGCDEGHQWRLDAGTQQPQHMRVVWQHRHRHHLPLELHHHDRSTFKALMTCGRCAQLWVSLEQTGDSWTSKEESDRCKRAQMMLTSWSTTFWWLASADMTFTATSCPLHSP